MHETANGNGERREARNGLLNARVRVYVYIYIYMYMGGGGGLQEKGDKSRRVPPPRISHSISRFAEHRF